MGGGSAESFTWRRIFLITSPWVITAMSRSAPRWHNGQVASSLETLELLLRQLIEAALHILEISGHADLGIQVAGLSPKLPRSGEIASLLFD